MENKTTWLRPAQMARKYNVTNQVVNYWKNSKNLLIKNGPAGITLVKETPRLLKRLAATYPPTN